MNVVLFFVMPACVFGIMGILVYLSLETSTTLFRTKRRFSEFRWSDWSRLLPVTIWLLLLTSLGVLTQHSLKSLLLIMATTGWIGCAVAILLYVRLPHIMDLTWDMAVRRVWPGYRSIAPHESSFADFFTADGVLKAERSMRARIMSSVSVFAVNESLLDVAHLYRIYLELTGHTEPSEAQKVNGMLDVWRKLTDSPLYTSRQWLTLNSDHVISLHMLIIENRSREFMVISLELPT